MISLVAYTSDLRFTSGEPYTERTAAVHAEDAGDVLCDRNGRAVTADDVQNGAIPVADTYVRAATDAERAAVAGW